MSRVVLTGASGFIGRHLVQYLALQPQVSLLLVVRRALTWAVPDGVQVRQIADFRDEAAWKELLKPEDIVIHLAGLAHRDLPPEVQVEGFFEANVATTRAIAQAAALQMVNSFIFISSIGVYGSSRDDIVRPDSAVHPDHPYAESKLAAELALLSVPNRHYNCTILRLPLVYGAAAPGNFGKLLRLVGLGIPLPFAGLNNRKSFLGIETLNQILHRLIRAPLQGDFTLIAAEQEAVTLATLLQHLSHGMGKTSRLFYVPAWLLKALLTAVGQKKMYKKLCLTLEADSSQLFDLINWRPQQSVGDIIQKVGSDYQGSRRT